MIIENKAGIAVGAGAGIYEGGKSIISSLSQSLYNINFIQWESVLQVGIYAFVGGILGWMGSELMSQLKKTYKEWKNDKNNK